MLGGIQCQSPRCHWHVVRGSGLTWSACRLSNSIIIISRLAIATVTELPLRLWCSLTASRNRPGSQMADTAARRQRWHPPRRTERKASGQRATSITPRRCLQVPTVARAGTARTQPLGNRVLTLLCSSPTDRRTGAFAVHRTRKRSVRQDGGHERTDGRRVGGRSTGWRCKSTQRAGDAPEVCAAAFAP